MIMHNKEALSRSMVFLTRFKKRAGLTLSKVEGFTLIESFISILLLTIMLTGGLALYFNSHAIMAQAMHKKIAMEMANQAMEELKRDGYANLPAVTTNFVDLSPMVFGDFTAPLRRRVTDVNGTSLKEVEIEVCWKNCGTSAARVINLATYMSPPLP